MSEASEKSLVLRVIQEGSILGDERPDKLWMIYSQTRQIVYYLGWKEPFDLEFVRKKVSSDVYAGGEWLLAQMDDQIATAVRIGSIDIHLRLIKLWDYVCQHIKVVYVPERREEADDRTIVKAGEDPGRRRLASSSDPTS